MSFSYQNHIIGENLPNLATLLGTKAHTYIHGVATCLMHWLMKIRPPVALTIEPRIIILQKVLRKIRFARVKFYDWDGWQQNWIIAAEE
jgi:hypothetical protein